MILIFIFFYFFFYFNFYQGGKDAASARYIFTYLSKVTRLIFKKEDDNILEYLNDDGQMIEPNWYIYVTFFLLYYIILLYLLLLLYYIIYIYNNNNNFNL